MNISKITLFVAGCAMVLASCGGGSVESDVKKMVDIQCKMHEAELKSRKNPEDKASLAEVDKLSKELIELATKLEGKYKDKSEANKKAEELYDKEIEKCQAKKDLAKFEEEENARKEAEYAAQEAAYQASMDSLLNVTGETK